MRENKTSNKETEEIPNNVNSNQNVKISINKNEIEEIIINGTKHKISYIYTNIDDTAGRIFIKYDNIIVLFFI